MNNGRSAGRLHQGGEGDALFGFMGAQAGGNGLLYVNGRYYDPSTGRFLSPDNSNFDPMRPGTLNGYLAAVFLANPGGLLFGPLLILNWRRRRGSKGTYTVLLLLGVGLVWDGKPVGIDINNASGVVDLT